MLEHLCYDLKKLLWYHHSTLGPVGPLTPWYCFYNFPYLKFLPPGRITKRSCHNNAMRAKFSRTFISRSSMRIWEVCPTGNIVHKDLYRQHTAKVCAKELENISNGFYINNWLWGGEVRNPEFIVKIFVSPIEQNRLQRRRPLNRCTSQSQHTFNMIFIQKSLQSLQLHECRLLNNWQRGKLLVAQSI